MLAGVATLASFINSLAFPMLGGCNMDTTAEPSLNIKKWHVFTVEGRKVALLGYIAGDTGTLTSAGDVQFSDPVRAQDLPCASTADAMSVCEVMLPGVLVSVDFLHSSGS